MFAGTIPKSAQTTLALLGESRVVKDAYLAGGSALALHFGHRLSIDFDFFTPQKFDPVKLGKSLSKIGKFEQDLAKGISLIGAFNGVKLSYFGYNYPLISTFSSFLNVNIAGVADIAAMKIVVLMDRGTKKDFVDLFELVNRGYGVEKIFSFYQKKYGRISNNIFSIIKSLGYFDDAEKSDMPQMIKKVSWQEVKDFFAEESMRLAKKYIG